MTIRPEEPRDLASVHAVNAACFPTEVEARLVDALRAAGNLTLSLVAERDGEVVGHVAFSPVTIDGAPEPRGVGLAPLAVLEPHRRAGLGAALVREGLERCRSAGWAFAVVLGDPAYYGRFGFRPARELGLHDEYGGGDAFQALELIPGVPAGRSGLVRYAPQFAIVA